MIEDDDDRPKFTTSVTIYAMIAKRSFRSHARCLVIIFRGNFTSNNGLFEVE